MKRASLYVILTLITLVSAAIWYRAQQTPTFAAESNTVIVGINSEFPPFSFKEDDTFVGFDIDVIEEVFKRLKKQIVFKDMPFDALIPEIQIGNIHVIAAGMTPTEERAERVPFTYPHLKGNPLVIISPKHSTSTTEQPEPLTTVADLDGKTVVVNEGYFADSFISEQPGVNLLRLSSALVGDGMLALQSGRADAFVTATYSIKPYFEKYDRNEFNVTPIAGTEETSAFAVSKHYPDLRRAIQVTLNEMEQDGTLAQLKTKWDLL
jgi:arginine/lysine/histidine transporter system substrate-binding protein